MAKSQKIDPGRKEKVLEAIGPISAEMEKQIRESIVGIIEKYGVFDTIPAGITYGEAFWMFQMGMRLSEAHEITYRELFWAVMEQWGPSQEAIDTILGKEDSKGRKTKN